MSVSEYAQWWASDERKGSLRYLKDWHLAALEPEYAAYEVPPCLGEDWLNEHWAACAASTGAAPMTDVNANRDNANRQAVNKR